jgi:hypothetical protein
VSHHTWCPYAASIRQGMSISGVRINDGSHRRGVDIFVFFLKLFEYDVSPQLWWLGLARE